MRKSFDGLCGLVITVMGRQPTSGEVFVFLNRNRTHIKLLVALFFFNIFATIAYWMANYRESANA